MTVTKFPWVGMLQPRHFAWLSIAAAVATILLKTLAWWLTGSVGLLSDALESFVNLAGASVALWAIALTERPPDDEHPFGHAKAEYISSGFEGLLIVGAAVAILWAAAARLLAPLPLASLGLGMVVTAASTLINLAVAIALGRAGRRFGSVALAADARHLMTDVVTSVGVIVGIGAVWATGWLILDPLIALVVGAHILVQGVGLLRGAFDGLMDRSLDVPAQRALRAALDEFAPEGVAWRNLRTRRAGARSWVDVDVLVPGTWTVERGHRILDRIEAALRERVPGAGVRTHLEPLDAGDEPAAPSR